MSKICGVYKITNNINGMEYCGQSVNCIRRWCNHKTTSSKRLIDLAIKEFGKENFTFQIYKECLPEELDFYEQEAIREFNTLYPNGYNCQGGGKQSYSDVCEDTRRKMSESAKNKPHMSEETRRKHSESMRGKNTGPLSEDVRRKISESAKNRSPMSDETKRKLSEANKGKKKPPLSEETRRKLSETLKNKPKLKWLTPSGEIREMCARHVSQWHPDWIKIEE